MWLNSERLISIQISEVNLYMQFYFHPKINSVILFVTVHALNSGRDSSDRKKYCPFHAVDTRRYSTLRYVTVCYSSDRKKSSPFQLICYLDHLLCFWLHMQKCDYRLSANLEISKYAQRSTKEQSRHRELKISTQLQKC